MGRKIKTTSIAVDLDLEKKTEEALAKVTLYSQRIKDLLNTIGKMHIALRHFQGKDLSEVKDFSEDDAAIYNKTVLDRVQLNINEFNYAPVLRNCFKSFKSLLDNNVFKKDFTISLFVFSCIVGSTLNERIAIRDGFKGNLSAIILEVFPESAMDEDWFTWDQEKKMDLSRVVYFAAEMNATYSALLSMDDRGEPDIQPAPGMLNSIFSTFKNFFPKPLPPAENSKDGSEKGYMAQFLSFIGSENKLDDTKPFNEDTKISESVAIAGPVVVDVSTQAFADAVDKLYAEVADNYIAKAKAVCFSDVVDALKLWKACLASSHSNVEPCKNYKSNYKIMNDLCNKMYPFETSSDADIKNFMDKSAVINIVQASEDTNPHIVSSGFNTPFLESIAKGNGPGDNYARLQASAYANIQCSGASCSVESTPLIGQGCGNDQTSDCHQ